MSDQEHKRLAREARREGFPGVNVYVRAVVLHRGVARRLKKVERGLGTLLGAVSAQTREIAVQYEQVRYCLTELGKIIERASSVMERFEPLADDEERSDPGGRGMAGAVPAKD
jgi:hypothetical protein